MLSLHNATEEIRVLIKWLAILVGIVIIIVLLIRIGLFVRELFFPTPPSPPTVKFGKIPLVSFPESNTDLSLTYTLDTVSGDLPEFPDRITVNKILPSQPNLLALQRAQEKVQQVGFITQPVAITENLYEWNNPTPPNKKMILDIITFNFDLTSNYLNDPAVINSRIDVDEFGAIAVSENFLISLQSTPEDLNLEKTKTTLLSIVNGSLTEATSLSNSQLIRVDFFQNDVNELPIQYPKPPFSSMNFFVGSKTIPGQIVEAHYFHHTVTDISATYPIITADKAYEQLQNGNAYIASYYGTNTSIKITNVYLAYYLGEATQEYLYPVIVFEGSDGFFAYIPAIPSEWLE